MFVARCALGRQIAGQAGLRRPPQGYDSVHGGGGMGHTGLVAGAPQGKFFAHVLFDNQQSYPEYLVTFRP
jgi:hypothetical protein